MIIRRQINERWVGSNLHSSPKYIQYQMFFLKCRMSSMSHSRWNMALISKLISSQENIPVDWFRCALTKWLCFKIHKYVNTREVLGDLWAQTSRFNSFQEIYILPSDHQMVLRNSCQEQRAAGIVYFLIVGNELYWILCTLACFKEGGI